MGSLTAFVKSRLSEFCMLVGTFIETGGGMIHAINERIAGALEAAGKTLSSRNRAFIAIGLLIVAFFVSGFGLIDLIAIGYGTLTWVFIAVLVVPLFTKGMYKILRSR